MEKLQIYVNAIQENEPFRELNIRSLKFEDKTKTHIVTCDESEKEFYGLYGLSENKPNKDGLWWSIADSPSKVELFELATSFNIFAGFTLPITTKFEI